LRSLEFGELTASKLTSTLEAEGWLYLRALGRADATLLGVGEMLGTIVTPGVGMPNGAHDGQIYRVEIRNAGAGFADQHGNTILSTTNQEFALHTDAFNRHEPPRYVFLARSDDSEDMTRSYLADAREALQLIPEFVARLSEPIFPSALGAISLVSVASTGQVRVRFNPEELRRWDGRDGNPPITSETELLIAKFSQALQAVVNETVIAPGDCLVMDNWRVCHGRGEMAADSQRVLKRMWVA
jgi:alpha-ketoglutarate-dependent taurine dioxygenase